MSDIFRIKEDKREAFRASFQKEVSIPEGMTNRVAAMTALAGDSEDPVKEFQTISEDLQLGKESPAVEELEQEEVRIRQQELKENLGDIALDPTLSDEEKFAKIEAFRAEDYSDINLSEAFQRQAVLKAEVDTQDAEYVQMGVYEHLNQVAMANDAIEHFKRTGLDVDGSALGIGVSALVVGIAPTTFGPQVVDAVTKVAPELVEFGDSALPGELVNKLKEHMQTLPPKERVLMAQDIIEAIDKDSFLGADVDMIQIDILETLLGDLKVGNWDKTMNNFFGVLDALAVLPLRGAYRAVKGIGEAKKTKRELDRLNKIRDEILNSDVRKKEASVSSILDEVSPLESAKIAEAAIGMPTVAKTLGETPESLLNEHVMPNPMGSDVRVTPDLNVKSDRVLDADPSHLFLNDEEHAVLQAGIRQRMDALAESLVYQSFNKTQIEEIPGGYRAKAILQANEQNGYSSLKAAQADAAALQGIPESDVTILARKWDEGVFVPLDEFTPVGKQQEYVIQVTHQHLINPEDALGTVDVVRDGKLTGTAAKHFGKDSWLVEWISRASSVTVDQKHFREKELKRIISPLYNLKADDQFEVLKMLDRGDRNGEWYGPTELLEEWKDTPNAMKKYEAYNSVVRHQKEIHRMVNDQVRRDLVGQNARTLVLKGMSSDSNQFIGLPVTNTSNLNIENIWDTSTKSRIQFDPDTLNEGIANGELQVFKVVEGIEDAKGISNYAIIRADDKLNIVQDLPLNVIQQHDGYISRIYDTTWIVKKRREVLEDGVKRTKWEAHAMYKSMGEAEALRNRLAISEGIDIDDIEALEKGSYRVVKANELRDDSEYANRLSLDYLKDSGQLFTSSRGPEVINPDRSRNLKSIVDSLGISATRAASMGTTDALISKLMRNWQLKYSDLFEVPNGTMPLLGNSKNIIRSEKGNDALHARDVRDAVAMRDHIRLLAGVDDTMLRSAYKKTVDRLAEAIGTPVQGGARNALARGIYSVREKNPLNVPKMINFLRMMIFSPARQAMLQSQQMTVYLGMDHALKYFGPGGGGMSDFLLLQAGAYARDTKGWEALAKTLGPRHGMTAKEYTEFVDDFRRSGLFDSVDSHVWAQPLNVDRKLAHSDKQFQKIWGTGANTAKDITRLVRRGGFDLGERVQLTVAWLVMRNRWMKDNPDKAHLWNKDKNLLTFTADARRVSLDMNEAGTLEFQRNFLALGGQFTSHVAKSMQFLLPSNTPVIGDLSLKVVRSHEKRRIALIQLGLYGTGGYGLAGYIQSFFPDIPDDVSMVIDEGSAGVAINMALRAAEDQTPFSLEDRSPDDVNLQISQSIAPFSGIGGGGQLDAVNHPLAKVISGVFMTDKGALEVFLGPTFSTGRDISDATKMALFIAGYTESDSDFMPKFVDRPLPPGMTRELLILDQFATALAPIYGKLVRARMEEKLGYLINKEYEPLTRANATEIYSRAVFGISPTRHGELQDAIREIRGGMKQTEEGINTALTEEAKRIFKYYKQLIRRKNDGEITVEEVFKMLQLNSEALALILPEHEHSKIFDDQLRTMIFSDLVKDGTESKFALEMERMFTNGGVWGPDEIIKRIKVMAPFEKQQELIDKLESLE